MVSILEIPSSNMAQQAALRPEDVAYGKDPSGLCSRVRASAFRVSSCGIHVIAGLGLDLGGIACAIAKLNELQCPRPKIVLSVLFFHYPYMTPI